MWLRTNSLGRNHVAASSDSSGDALLASCVATSINTAFCVEVGCLFLFATTWRPLQAGANRLRRVAQLCQNFGVRVQFSVFECRIRELTTRSRCAQRS